MNFSLVFQVGVKFSVSFVIQSITLLDKLFVRYAKSSSRMERENSSLILCTAGFRVRFTAGVPTKMIRSTDNWDSFVLNEKLSFLQEAPVSLSRLSNSLSSLRHFSTIRFTLLSLIDEQFVEKVAMKSLPSSRFRSVLNSIKSGTWQISWNAEPARQHHFEHFGAHSELLSIF